jgi:hypothetical protein
LEASSSARDSASQKPSPPSFNNVRVDFDGIEVMDKDEDAFAVTKDNKPRGGPASARKAKSRAVNEIAAMFPERLHQCLLFPVPQAANWIWNIVKAWIDPDTSRKVQLLKGHATKVSQPPFEAMEKFLEPEVAKLLENKCHATFIEDTRNVAR